MSLGSSLHDVLGEIYQNDISEDLLPITSEAMRKCNVWINNHVLGMILILNADWNRYSQLIVELSNNHAKGVNNYPSTFAEYFALVLNHVPNNPSKSNKPRNDEEHEKGLALAQ